jgi:hypothetical protein
MEQQSQTPNSNRRGDTMKKLLKKITMTLTVLTMVAFSTAAFAGNNYSIYGDNIFSDTEKTETKTD